MSGIKLSILSGIFVANVLFPVSAANAGEVTILEGYSDFRSPGSITLERPMHAVLDDLVGFPEFFGETSPELQVKSYFDAPDRLVIDVVESGLLDDSVTALNRKFVLEETDEGKFRIHGYGYRQKCSRGDGAGKWVATACP